MFSGIKLFDIHTNDNEKTLFFVAHDSLSYQRANVNKRKQMETFILSRIWPWPVVNLLGDKEFFGDCNDTCWSCFYSNCMRFVYQLGAVCLPRRVGICGIEALLNALIYCSVVLKTTPFVVSITGNYSHGFVLIFD